MAWLSGCTTGNTGRTGSRRTGHHPPLSTIVGFLPALNSYDAYAALGSIQAHTVVVSGGADLLTPPQRMLAI